MKVFKPLFPFLAGWALLMMSVSFSEIGLINGVLQIILFALVVNLPALKTDRMSYVDIGWPWGLVLIGLLSYIYGTGDPTRRLVIMALYGFCGLRMALFATSMFFKGAFKNEFPRYNYQRLRWEKQGQTNVKLAMQVEILVQALANASFLAFPAFLMAMNTDPNIHLLEIVGLVIWVGAFIMESVADSQKVKFLVKMKKEGLRKQVCNVGLWKVSRHPNYFAEWMVWNGLIVMAIPSFLNMDFYLTENLALYLFIGLGTLFASRIMYVTLVYYTGAVPAEYYSVQKRPDYKNYQATTNMFFPWKNKKIDGKD